MAPRCCPPSGVPARLVLGIMAFLMFVVTQMIRLSLNIAIVAMEEEATVEVAMEKVTVANNSANVSQDGVSVWPAQATGVLLGAFYWSYWLTELPGGMLAQRLGARAMLAGGAGLAAGLHLLLPLACRAHFWAAAAVRAMQGLALGVTWPAMHCLAAHWIPKTERSKFMTSYHGAAIGNALTYPMGGLIIATLGWEYVFYITGLLTMLWCVAWLYLVYDSPVDHPRISVREKIYLEEHLGKSVSPSKMSPLQTPWKSILTSAPFWAVLVASQGLMWGSITLSMQMPTYFATVHNLDIETNGLVSGIPDLSKFVFGLIFSSVMDYMLKKEYISMTSTRKIAVAVCEYIPGLLLIALACFGSRNAAIAAALLSFTTAVGGASSTGSLANIVDISPNFAGTLLGLIKVLTFIPGVLSPMIVSLLASNMEKGMNWPYVFGMLAAVYALCCTIFLIFGSGEVQPWNESKESSLGMEMDDLMEKKECNGHNK